MTLDQKGRKPMHTDEKLRADIQDFWQAIMDTGYIMEGENRGYEREKMKWLAGCLDSWFAEHPEIKEDGPLEHFAMHAVGRLVKAFVFNDQVGADRPEFRAELFDRVIAAIGGPEQLSDKIAEIDDDPPAQNN